MSCQKDTTRDEIFMAVTKETCILQCNGKKDTSDCDQNAELKLKILANLPRQSSLILISSVN
jgi:hypothetical protein